MVLPSCIEIMNIGTHGTGAGIHCTLKTCTYLLELTKRQVHGYAIGGLAGGESKDDFWKMVVVSAKSLPDNKPRYTMGIGFALDLVVCTALGSDMYDCVFPTRTAVSYKIGRASCRERV